MAESVTTTNELTAPASQEPLSVPDRSPSPRGAAVAATGGAAARSRSADRHEHRQMATEQVTGAANSRPSPTFLRLAAGFVYFQFGLLKFFPDLSDAELIAGQTIMRVTNHWLDATTALWWLGVVECAIGLGFLFNIGLRWLFFVFLAHQASTFLPLFLFPELTFKFVPLAPTLEGQYILKNLISVAAGWTIMLPAVKEGWRRKPRAGDPAMSSAPASRVSP